MDSINDHDSLQALNKPQTFLSFARRWRFDPLGRLLSKPISEWTLDWTTLAVSSLVTIPSMRMPRRWAVSLAAAEYCRSRPTSKLKPIAIIDR